MMKIGELARQAGVDVQTVRYYEREGLITAPSRTASGYRAYGPGTWSASTSSAIAARSTCRSPRSSG